MKLDEIVHTTVGALQLYFTEDIYDEKQKRGRAAASPLEYYIGWDYLGDYVLSDIIGGHHRYKQWNLQRASTAQLNHYIEEALVMCFATVRNATIDKIMNTPSVKGFLNEVFKNRNRLVRMYFGESSDTMNPTIYVILSREPVDEVK